MDFQTATVDINIGGEAGMQVHRSGITVPEILVLRAIHGQDSVKNITPSGDERRSIADELDRLERKYTARTSDDAKRVVRALFPGATPTLPSRLHEIGIGDDIIPAKRGGARKAKALVEAVTAEPDEDESSTE